jgi:S1-C subfamily serine protease
MLARLAATFAALLLAAAPAAAAPGRATGTSTGVVDIETVLRFQNSAAAGTGMIVSRSGQVLTNNHVIRGATSIRVVDVNTGKRYTATVLGYSVSSDVALLKLNGASGLTTVSTGNSAKVSVGDNVTAVGNAGGAGGAPSVSSGRITGVGRSIVATDDQGAAQRLTGLLQMDAQIRPGESGGPLLDRESRVIGMITAGSLSFRFDTSTTRGFAVPINKALAIAKQIAAGRSSATVHVGKTAFLGVSVADPGSEGALVREVVPESAAERAGLVAGDTITSLDGRTVDSPTSIQRIVLSLKPGTPVAIRWKDESGGEQTGRITPAAGPPQ